MRRFRSFFFVYVCYNKLIRFENCILNELIIYFFMFKNIVIVCFAFLFLPTKLKSQQFLHREYGVVEGLNNPYVYALAQDKNRFIWIGTAEGLYQYNGREFKPYYIKDGLASNFVYSICVDNQNNKWLGHEDGSITLFTDKFFLKRKSDTILNTRINKIVQKGNRKVIVCTQSNGLFEMDLNFKTKPIALFAGDEIIWDVAEISGGHLIVCTDQGVYILPFQNGKYESKVALEELKYISVLSVSKAKLLGADFILGTEYDGIYTLQIGPNLKPIIKRLNETGVEPGDQLYFANFDHKDELWVSRHQSGVTKSIVENTKVTTQKSYWQESFKNYYIKSFLLDNEGNYWLGTYGNGIIQLTNNIFLLSKPSQFKNESFKVKAVAAKGDSVFVSTGSDLFLFFQEKFEKLSLGTIPNNRKSPILITCLYYDNAAKRLLIGTNDFGVLAYDQKTATMKQFYFNDIANNINNIVNDRQGNIWVATENGAFRYESKSKTFSSFTMANGLAHNNVHTIYADRRNRIWFATHNSGMSYFENGVVKFLPTPYKSKPIDINSFAESQDSTLWIGTNGDGLVCLKDTSVTNYINRQNGLLSNFCYTLAFNEQGNLWVGHKNGLSEITPATNKIYNTSNSDLLQEVEMYLNAISTNKHITWYGTNKGLLKYNPADAFDGGKENSTMITSVKVFFNQPDSVKYNYFKNFLFPPDDLNFSFKDNHLTFEFIGICMSDPNKVMYKYFLEGYDEKWNPETHLNQVTYANLDPGTYTFHLISMNQNGFWNSKPTLYHFEIVPPFYRTWWFYVLIASLSVFAVIGIFTYRTHQLRRKNEFLEGEKIKLESEILQRKMTEEKLKRSEILLQRANEELNTFIWRSYHDLRGPLKTIQGLVYVALSEAEKKVIVSYLELINTTTAKLDGLLQQFSKVTEVRRSKIAISKVNIEEIIQSSIAEVLREHGIVDSDFTKDINVSGTLYFDKNFLFTLFHHLLDNAVIFAKDKFPIVNIKVRQYGAQLKIVISDKGTGIQPEALPKVFDMFYKGTSVSKGYGLGLYIVGKIASVFDGTVNIFSSYDEGTTVIVRLKNQEKFKA